MVIVNIKLLSGYVLEKSSLHLVSASSHARRHGDPVSCAFVQLKTDGSVKRVDVEDGYVNIYLDGVRGRVGQGGAAPAYKRTFCPSS